MSILASEIKLYKSLVVSDTNSNGGRMSSNLIASGALANLFDHVTPEEKAAGSIKYRKFFTKIANDDDLTLFATKIFLDAPTPGDDWVTLFAGTQRDTMADHTTPRRYGSAFLQENVSAGAATIIVTVENAALSAIFQNGDPIVITDKVTPTSVSGNREVFTISGAPSVVGTQVTIGLSGTLANSYTTAANARASSCLAAGDVSCSVSNWSETGSGTYDETTYPVLCDNIGTIEQTWTLTFSDATTYTCVGDTVGSVGSGTVGSNFSPSNAAFAKPYFTLRAAGHGGTWTANNTITFQTHPAAPAGYLRRDVPAGAAAIGSNKVTIVALGATA
jgi:hypothetical protein